MAHKNERISAKRMYIEDNIEVPEIAKRMAIPEATVYRWKADDETAGSSWDKQREEISTTSFSALKQSMILANKKLQAMAESGQINPADLDAISKLAKFAERMDKNVNVRGNIILMVEELVAFASERYPEKLDDLQPLLAEFGQAMDRKYSKKR